MTTSTTDAEAIAREANAAAARAIETMIKDGAPICMREGETTWRTYHAGFDLSAFSQRITDEVAAAILSYLASRREAQEPIHQYRRRGCSDWYDGHPDRSDGKDYETRVVYLGPPKPQEPVAWRYRTSINGKFGKWTVQKNKPHWFEDEMTGVELEPLYTASPAPAGEVERLLTEMQPHIDKIERCADANDEWGRVVTGQTDAAREIARIARAALNGGQSE